jgi:hypothetical protein
MFRRRIVSSDTSSSGVRAGMTDEYT